MAKPLRSAFERREPARLVPQSMAAAIGLAITNAVSALNARIALKFELRTGTEPRGRLRSPGRCAVLRVLALTERLRTAVVLHTTFPVYWCRLWPSSRKLVEGRCQTTVERIVKAVQSLEDALPPEPDREPNAPDSD